MPNISRIPSLISSLLVLGSPAGLGGYLGLFVNKNVPKRITVVIIAKYKQAFQICCFPVSLSAFASDSLINNCGSTNPQAQPIGLAKIPIDVAS